MGWKISENLNDRGVGKIGIFYQAQTHEKKELYSLYSSQGNYDTIQDD